MAEANKQAIDKINQIKKKLNKYLGLKNNTKIHEYLTLLSNIVEINLDVLKATLIVDFLKEIKKKELPTISPLSQTIIFKWKSILRSTLTPSSASSSSVEVAAASSSTSSKALAAAPSTKTSEKSSTTATNASSKKRHNTNGNADAATSQEKTSSSSSSHKNTTASSSSNNNGSSKQRAQSPKRAKLSLDDYKSKKGSDEQQTTSSQATDQLKSVKKEPTSSRSTDAAAISLNGLFTHKSEQQQQQQQQQLQVKREDDTESRFKSTSNLSKYVASLAVPNSSMKRPSEEDENDALQKIFASKNSKKVLYTGRKVGLPATGAQVPSLFSLCTKTLVDSLDELPNRISIYNMSNRLPVAFQCLKGVLEKANAKQLADIEYFSPNLSEDTEPLWRSICEKEFKRVEKPEEDENWRDLYYKKVDEREENYRRVREAISQKQANKPQKRQTQLVTVKLLSAAGGGGSTTVIKSSSSSSSSRHSSSVVHHSSSSSSSSRQASAAANEERVTVRMASSNLMSGQSRKPFQLQAPAMSKGMKATMKLMKKTNRR